MCEAAMLDVIMGQSQSGSTLQIMDLVGLVGRHHIPSQEDVDGRRGTTGKLETKQRTTETLLKIQRKKKQIE